MDINLETTAMHHATVMQHRGGLTKWTQQSGIRGWVGWLPGREWTVRRSEKKEWEEERDSVQ